MFHSATRRLVAAGLIALCAGCAAGQGPRPPEFRQLRTDTQRRIDASRGLILRGTHAVDRLESVRRRLDTLPADLDRSAFPDRLFKHVAMTCLSTLNPPEGADPTPPETSFGLVCRPPHAADLDRALRDAPKHVRTTARQTLRAIDAFRRSRAALRDIVEESRQRADDNREYLAGARADFQRRRETLKNRRAEFPLPDWRALRRRLTARADQLDELEQIDERLRKRSGAWPERLAELQHGLYFAVTSGWD